MPLWKWVSDCVLLLLLMSSLAVSQTTEKEEEELEEEEGDVHHYLTSDGPRVLAALANYVRSVWSKDVIDSAVSLRREVRSVGRQVRDISSVFYPIISSLSAVAQGVSYLPGVMQVLVKGVSGVVEVLGSSIVMFGTGIDLSAAAINTVGRSIQTVSASVPSLVTGVVVGGGIMLLLYPGLQDAVFDGIASVGLMLAGRAAAGARNFVDKNSFWSTLLQTLEIFTQRARQDYI